MMMTLDRMYMPRMSIRTLGSSIGIFLETCIITRMITKLVLRNQSVGLRRWGRHFVHLRAKSRHCERERGWPRGRVGLEGRWVEIEGDQQEKTRGLCNFCSNRCSVCVRRQKKMMVAIRKHKTRCRRPRFFGVGASPFWPIREKAVAEDRLKQLHMRPSFLLFRPSINGLLRSGLDIGRGTAHMIKYHSSSTSQIYHLNDLTIVRSRTEVSHVSSLATS